MMDAEDALTELRLMLDLSPSADPAEVVRAVQRLNAVVDRLVDDDDADEQGQIT